MNYAQIVEAKRKKEFKEALQYMDSLYKGALRMTRNETAAEDLVQDTYLRAYQFFNKFKKGTNLKAWLSKILQNVYINKYNAALRTPVIVDVFDAEMAGELIIKATQEDEIFGKLLDDEVTKAMEALPKQFRLTVLLSDMEDLSYKETAATLNCPLGTVMSRLHRGRKALRNSLADYVKERS